MNKGFKGFLIGLLVIVAGFFITSLCLASVNNHSVVDEWKSWFPKEEAEVVVEDTANDIDPEVSVDPLPTTPAESEE